MQRKKGKLVVFIGKSRTLSSLFLQLDYGGLTWLTFPSYFGSPRFETLEGYLILQN